MYCPTVQIYNKNGGCHMFHTFAINGGQISLAKDPSRPQRMTPIVCGSTDEKAARVINAVIALESALREYV